MVLQSAVTAVARGNRRANPLPMVRDRQRFLVIAAAATVQLS